MVKLSKGVENRGVHLSMTSKRRYNFYFCASIPAGDLSFNKLIALKYHSNKLKISNCVLTMKLFRQPILTVENCRT